MKVGVYCGSTWYRPSTWLKYYGFFRRIKGVGFSVGPWLFYKSSGD